MKKENKNLMRPTMPLLTKSPTLQNPEADINADRFKQSLRELKDLRSQLYHAAEHCENAFLKTNQKKIVLDNTKSYLCEVIVTVVDHLGTVSSNLEQRVHNSDNILQTEQRIDCLNQRLLTCQQYALSLDMSSLLLISKFPRHDRHYISPFAKDFENPSDISRAEVTENQFTEAANEPSFDPNIVIKSPVLHLASGTGLTTVLPVFERPSRSLKPPTLAFGSPAEDAFKLGSGDQKKKLSQGGNLLMFLRRSRRKTQPSLLKGDAF